MTHTLRKGIALLCILLLLAAPACAQEQDSTLANLNSATITLNGTSITVEGYGATVSGASVTITMPGVYTISGTLDNGQILVDCALDEKIELLLNGVSIHCEDGAAICILRSEKRTSIRLAPDTQNTLTSGKILDEKMDGVIFSKGDLTITGEGALDITATNTDGIVSKDDLRIKGGVLTVTTPEDGIRGKDSVEIYDGKINVVAGGDGIKSTNEDDADRGFIQISGGEIYIIYGDEALQPVTSLEITGGTLMAVCVEK